MSELCDVALRPLLPKGELMLPVPLSADCFLLRSSTTELSRIGKGHEKSVCT